MIRLFMERTTHCDYGSMGVHGKSCLLGLIPSPPFFNIQMQV